MQCNANNLNQVLWSDSRLCKKKVFSHKIAKSTTKRNETNLTSPTFFFDCTSIPLDKNIRVIHSKVQNMELSDSKSVKIDKINEIKFNQEIKNVPLVRLYDFLLASYTLWTSLPISKLAFNKIHNMLYFFLKILRACGYSTPFSKVTIIRFIFCF